MHKLHPEVEQVTQAIAQRSEALRKDYLTLMRQQREGGVQRGHLSCGNLAHGFASCPAPDKQTIRLMDAANIAIVTAYNDMLSAHQPYGEYPDTIKAALREVGCTAQVAGGVPAMCDGVTQGKEGMDLSLFSRDVIAQATAVALTHNMFDGILCLGICDKIVPGLLIGALRFGHLPMLFVPAGPMPSGLPNQEKARIRQLYAEGKVDREQLLEAESQSYHSPGTCTFYGTANSNQVMMEAMGLQLPGSSFVNPGTELRQALVHETARQISRITLLGNDYRPLGEQLDARALVNATVALLATGGSTNHTMHLVTIARSAGLILRWHDIARLSAVVPLLAKVYPTGSADVNHFRAAGGTGFLFQELLSLGLMHGDLKPAWGERFSDSYRQEPFLQERQLVWRPAPAQSADEQVLRPGSNPFSSEGGIKIMQGNLGQAVIKVSAVAEQHRFVEAPARVFFDQDDLRRSFEKNELNEDFIAVVIYQGPHANGMPELHKLTPFLGVLQDRGYKVALVTDGRMSGASGKVPTAIHVTPEASRGGLLARVRDGDLIRIDAERSELQLLVSDDVLKQRQPVQYTPDNSGFGRELFAGFRQQVSSADLGATVLFSESDREREARLEEERMEQVF